MEMLAAESLIVDGAFTGLCNSQTQHKLRLRFLFTY